MDFTQLAETRFSVRKFTSDAVPSDIIERILHAGHVAPTGCNNQPQRILIINTPESLEKLHKCTRYHFNAPLAMLVCYNDDECWHRSSDGAACGIVDASIVTTHMMLEATQAGIGSTWVMSFDPNVMRNEFNIPSNIIPVALLTMGYAAPDAEPYPGHSSFRPMEETVLYEHF